jgi:flagellar biogenesis protein FliO
MTIYRSTPSRKLAVSLVLIGVLITLLPLSTRSAAATSELGSPYSPPAMEKRVDLSAAQETTAARRDQSLPGLLRLTVGLIVVLGLFFLLMYLLRRSGYGTSLAENGVTLLASKQVGARERVVHVSLGNRHFLLGVAAGRVSAIHHWIQTEEEGVQ